MPTWQLNMETIQQQYFAVGIFWLELKMEAEQSFPDFKSIFKWLLKKRKEKKNEKTV